MQWTICCLVYFICGDSSSEYTSILQIRKKVSADVTLSVLCIAPCVLSSFQVQLYHQRCFPVKQNREAWGGFDMEGVLRYSTSNVKWSGELGWEAALNSPSGVARLWAQMAPALLWGKQFHSHWGHSSSEQMRLFYCNVLWTEITGECHLAGKQDELDGVMLFGWIYWLCSHGLQNHIFTVLLNTNLVWCYVRWRKAGQEENIWSLITGCDLFSCPLQNFHCFLTMAQAFILLNKHLNLTY